MIKKSDFLLNMNEDAIQIIFGFLSRHDFIQISFMLNKQLTFHYQYAVHKELMSRLLVSWDIDMSDNHLYHVLNSLSTNITTTITTISKTIEINKLRILLSQAVPALNSFKKNSSDHIIIINNNHNNNMNNHNNNSLYIQYTGSIGVGDRSVLTQKAFPVSIDKIKLVTQEIEKLYTNFISTNNTNNNTNTTTTNNNKTTNHITAMTNNSTRDNNNNNTNHKCTSISNLSLLPTSIRSIIKTAQLLKHLYEMMKNAKEMAEEAPIFTTPFQCKANYHHHHHHHRHHHDDDDSIKSVGVAVTDYDTVSSCSHVNGHQKQQQQQQQQQQSMALLSSSQQYILSPNSKVITYYGSRSVAYFEVSILTHHHHHHHHQQSPLASSMSSPNNAIVNNDTGIVDRVSATTASITQYRNTSTGSINCVAVGLASTAFDHHTKFPGWDYESYGYHGDDGAIFHGNGQKLSFFGPSFGVGDVVGCGLNYREKNIFFTLNGHYLGVAFENVNTCIPFHPVIGIDTNYIIHANFGKDEVFAFDLYHYVVCDGHNTTDDCHNHNNHNNNNNNDDDDDDDDGMNNNCINKNCGNVIRYDENGIIMNGGDNNTSGNTSSNTHTNMNGVSLYRSTSFAARHALDHHNNSMNNHNHNHMTTNDLSSSSSSSSSSSTVIADTSVIHAAHTHDDSSSSIGDTILINNNSNNSHDEYSYIHDDDDDDDDDIIHL